MRTSLTAPAVIFVALAVVSVRIEATGNATHLGRFTLAIPHIVNQAASAGNGSYEFVAANGDTLTADLPGKPR